MSSRQQVAIVVLDAYQQQALELTFADTATVADLLETLVTSGFVNEAGTDGRSSGIWLGHDEHSGNVLLAAVGLFAGCTVALVAPEPVDVAVAAMACRDGRVQQAVAGLRSGRIVALPSSCVGCIADPDSIWEQCHVIDGKGTPATARRDRLVHRVPSQVGPDRATEAAVGELVLPAVPSRPERPSMLVLLAPIPVALVVALILNPLFMLFAASGLVTAGARHIDALRRYRKSRRRHQLEVSELEDEFASRLDSVIGAETKRRRRKHPTAYDVLRRATGDDPRLWERRRGDSDFGVVAVARGIEPLFEGADQTVSMVPLVADLGTVSMGIVGPRSAAVGVARSVALSLAVNSDPGAHPFALLLGNEGADDWDPLKWLPHLSTNAVATSSRTLADVAQALSQLTDNVRPIVFCDGVELWRLASAEIRSRFDRAGLVVVANETNALPAQCRVIVRVSANGGCQVHYLDAPVSEGDRDKALAIGVSVGFAEQVARALAPAVDADSLSDASGRNLPDTVSLTDIGGLVGDAAAISARWLSVEVDPGAPALVGVGVDGPVLLDLGLDGPHALLAGTTGSGKSEFLRTWILGMALATSPEDLNLVLIDYKGGGAFDACAQLPHTAAVVTDLDQYLGERALQGLQAELRRRELLLRQAAASDLGAYRKLGHRMARLVLVVDEFATLAAELPDVLDALVDVAQRGRSLGLHLVLATQRPAGVLDAKIRANTNLRIALRVQDEADSYDVIGVSDAVKLPPRCPGRAILRAGPDDLISFQAAYVSGRTAAITNPVDVRSFELGRDTALWSKPAKAEGGATDLERCVAVMGEAAEMASCGPVRQPWLPALPDSCCRTSTVVLANNAGGVQIAIADSPATQSREPVWFEPRKGHLVVHGVAQAETVATLLSVCAAVLDSYGPDRVRVHVVGGGNRDLSRGSPRSVSVSRDDADEVLNFVEAIEAQLDDRRRTSVCDGSLPDYRGLVLVVVDGIDSWIDGLTSSGSHDIANRVIAILRDGPSLGVVAVMSTQSERGVPARLSGQVSQRLAHRLADSSGFLGLGIRPSAVPDLSTRQAIDVSTGRHVVMIDPCSGPTCEHHSEEISIARSAR